LSYELLKNLLASHGEKNCDIVRCVLVKIGGVALEGGTANDAGRSDFLKGLSQQVVKAVGAHPNVSAPVTLGDASRAVMTLTRPAFVVSTGPFLFHVTLPRPRLRYPHWSSGQDIEDFWVIYSGSLFAAFKEVSDVPERSGIGQEFRELLLAQIPKETSFKCSGIGPTPLHPDFYVVSCRHDEGTKRGRPSSFQERRNLFIVVDDTNSKPEKLIEQLFLDLEMMVFSFYHESLNRREAEDITYEALQLFSDLSRTAQDIFSTPAWKLMRSRQLHRNARGHLSAIHEHLVERETQILRSTRGGKHFLETIAEHPILSEIHDYFRDELEDRAEVPESLTPALNYFETELSLALNIRTLLVAAILGSVMGAILGSLLTWTLGRFGHP
jgi:hypothetical protein